MEAPIACDGAASARYYEAVDIYYRENVLAGAECNCRQLDECTQSASPNGFAPAQLSLVGPNYAMWRGEKPWQIAVVSMQAGVPESPITLERRRAQFQARVSESFAQRNAHIKGTTSALRELWGRPPGVDRAGELLSTPQGDVHVLDAMSLVNVTLCSLIKKPGSMEGGGSATMHKNCVEHLRAIMGILEPTIVHSQGRRADERYPTPHRSLLQAFDSVVWHDDCVATARLGDRQIVWNAVGHPSAKGKVAWQHPTSAYFVDVVGPSLRRARELAEQLGA